MDYYTRIGKVLEEGKFDCVFFDDRLAMPGVYGDSVAEAVRYGARPVKLDLTAVLGGIIGATSTDRRRRPLTRRPTTSRTTWPAPSPRSTTCPAAAPPGTW